MRRDMARIGRILPRFARAGGYGACFAAGRLANGRIEDPPICSSAASAALRTVSSASLGSDLKRLPPSRATFPKRPRASAEPRRTATISFLSPSISTGSTSAPPASASSEQYAPMPRRRHADHRVGRFQLGAQLWHRPCAAVPIFPRAYAAIARTCISGSSRDLRDRG